MRSAFSRSPSAELDSASCLKRSCSLSYSCRISPCSQVPLPSTRPRADRTSARSTPTSPAELQPRPATPTAAAWTSWAALDYVSGTSYAAAPGTINADVLKAASHPWQAACAKRLAALGVAARSTGSEWRNGLRSRCSCDLSPTYLLLLLLRVTYQASSPWEAFGARPRALAASA